MATYSKIKGFTIQSLASDPLHTRALGGAWSAGTNYPTSTTGMFGAGITTANVTFGGSPSLTAANTYDGSTWTSTGALNTGRDDMTGGGTQTAAFAAGGGYPVKDNMETYNGSTWTVKAVLNTARAKIGGAGTTTSAIVAGGEPSGHTDLSEKWNGTTWTAVNTLNTSRHGLAGAGDSNTSALVFGGYVTVVVANTESWDGTCWTSVSDLNTSRYYLGGAGIQTSAIAIGGSQNPPVIANTELWDGSAWAEGNDLATAKRNMASGGTSINAMATGGSLPASTNGVEEWVAPSTVTVAQEGQVWYNTTSTVLKGYAKSVASGTWASSPNNNTPRAVLAGAGTTVDTTLIFGGPAMDAAETYDGSSWTTVASLVNARGQLMGCGTQTAGLAAGGGPGSLNYTEKYNGVCWSAVNTMNSGRNSGYASGTQTGALVFSGGIWNQPTLHKLVEEYNGTTWTVKTALTSSHMTNVNGLGVVSTSALCSSGYYYPPPHATALNEEWNGSSWSEKGDLNTARFYCAGAGPASSGILIGGEDPSTLYTKTEHWDGTTWTELADMAATKSTHAGVSRNSPASSAIVATGNPSPNVVTTTWSATGSAIKTFTAT